MEKKISQSILKDSIAYNYAYRNFINTFSRIILYQYSGYIAMKINKQKNTTQISTHSYSQVKTYLNFDLVGKIGFMTLYKMVNMNLNSSKMPSQSKSHTT